MEIRGYIPDWVIIGIIIGLAALAVAVVGLVLYLRHRKKDKQETAQYREAQSEKLDEQGHLVKELTTELNLFMDGMATAPDVVRDPYADGLRAIREYKFKEAKRLFEEALTKTKDHSQLSAIHQALGNALIYLGESKGSRDAYSKALKLAEYAGDDRARAWALNGLGLAERNLCDYVSATKYHEKGAALAATARDAAAAVANKGNLATVFMLEGDFKKALDTYENLLSIHRQEGQPLGAAVALGNMGVLLQYLGDMNGALKSHYEALNIDRRLNNVYGEATQLSNIANVLCEKGDFDGALELYTTGLQLHRRSGNLLGEANELGNIGTVLLRKDDLEGALENMNEALKIHRRLGYSLGEANELTNIGVVLKYKGDLSGALDCSDKALNIYRRIGNPLGVASALGNIGGLLKDQGDLAAGLEKLREALVIFTRLRNPLGEARQLGTIGVVYVKKREPAEALKYYEKALAIFERIGAAAEIEKMKKNVELAKAMLEEKGG